MCTGPKQLVFIFLSTARKTKFEAIAVGSTIQTIGLPYFKSYSVVIPPRVEQEQAVAGLIAAEKNLAEQVDGLAKLMDLKIGLMDDLLTGRVRITRLLSQAAQPKAEEST